MKFLMAVMLVLFVGCTTEHQKINGAAITDTADLFNKQGATAGSPITAQNLRNAHTNEATLGSPKTRLDTNDLAGQETNREQAQKDAEAGGFWFQGGYTLLTLVGVVASYFGATGVNNWISSLRTGLKEAQATSADWQQQAETANGYLTTVTTGVKKYLDNPADDLSITDRIGRVADKRGDRLGFDEAVKTSLQ